MFDTNIIKLREEDNLASAFATKLIENLSKSIELDYEHWPIIKEAALMLADSDRDTKKWHHKYFGVVKVMAEIVKEANV